MNWQSIYTHLKERGFAVFSLGQHRGKCTEPYLVLRNNGGLLEQGLTGQEYEVLLYYPATRYSQFEDYIEQVKETMNLLFPVLRLVDAEQPHYLDDEIEGYMTSLIYRVWKPNNINRLAGKE